ncbi:MAG: serine hydrolase [Chloroflexota bacterium]
MNGKKTLSKIFLAALLLSLALASCSGDNTLAETTGPPATAAVTATTTPLPATPIASPVAEEEPTSTATLTPFAPPDLAYLAAAFDDVLAEFDGIASYEVIDLQSGASVGHNAHLAISGTSLVKIPILVETYRVLDDEPTPAQTRLITETATLSGNYTANLLLELIAGGPNPFAGAEVVTNSMRRLGLFNSFIAVPYDEEPRPAYMPTYLTPANQNNELSTNPDPSMQTTVHDLARLLQMIYECSQGEGLLLDVFAGEVTARECTAVLEAMQANKIEALLEEGVPDDVPLAHKHGWVGDTHGDAGIVFAGEHPYVIGVALYRTGWLEWADSTEVMARLSRLAYEHFSNPSAYPASLLATPPASLGFQATTPTATPELPRVIVSGTGGAGLTVRDTPGGAEQTVLPEGTYAYRATEEQVTLNGFDWISVLAPDGARGWVVSDYVREP